MLQRTDSTGEATTIGGRSAYPYLWEVSDSRENMREFTRATINKVNADLLALAASVAEVNPAAASKYFDISPSAVTRLVAMHRDPGEHEYLLNAICRTGVSLFRLRTGTAFVYSGNEKIGRSPKDTLFPKTPDEALPDEMSAHGFAREMGLINGEYLRAVLEALRTSGVEVASTVTGLSSKNVEAVGKFSPYELMKASQLGLRGYELRIGSKAFDHILLTKKQQVTSIGTQIICGLS